MGRAREETGEKISGCTRSIFHREAFGEFQELSGGAQVLLLMELGLVGVGGWPGNYSTYFETCRCLCMYVAVIHSDVCLSR